MYPPHPTNNKKTQKKWRTINQNFKQHFYHQSNLITPSNQISRCESSFRYQPKKVVEGTQPERLFRKSRSKEKFNKSLTLIDRALKSKSGLSNQSCLQFSNEEAGKVTGKISEMKRDSLKKKQSSSSPNTKRNNTVTYLTRIEQLNIGHEYDTQRPHVNKYEMSIRSEENYSPLKSERKTVTENIDSNAMAYLRQLRRQFDDFKFIVLEELQREKNSIQEIVTKIFTELQSLKSENQNMNASVNNSLGSQVSIEQVSDKIAIVINEVLSEKSNLSVIEGGSRKMSLELEEANRKHEEIMILVNEVKSIASSECLDDQRFNDHSQVGREFEENPSQPLKVQTNQRKSSASIPCHQENSPLFKPLVSLEEHQVRTPAFPENKVHDQFLPIQGEAQKTETNSQSSIPRTRNLKHYRSSEDISSPEKRLYQERHVNFDLKNLQREEAQTYSQRHPARDRKSDQISRCSPSSTKKHYAVPTSNQVQNPSENNKTISYRSSTDIRKRLEESRASRRNHQTSRAYDRHGQIPKQQPSGYQSSKKGTSHLEKFYGAVQKLKTEIKEFKDISDVKDICMTKFTDRNQLHRAIEDRRTSETQKRATGSNHVTLKGALIQRT